MNTRRRLLAYFGLLSAAGAVIFVVLWLYGVPRFGIEGIQSAEYRRSITSVESLVDKERGIFAQWFEERRRELKLLSASEPFSEAVRQAQGPASRQKAQQRQVLQRQLTALKESNTGMYNYLYLADPVKGHIIAASEASWRHAPPGHHDVLHESSQPGLTEFVYLLGAAQQHEVVITWQVQGIDQDGFPNGELLGLLVASVALHAPLRDEEKNVDQQLGYSGALMVIDRNRAVVATNTAFGLDSMNGASFDYVRHSVDPGADGVKVIQAPDGKEMLVAFRHLHLGASDGLSLVVIRAADDALASIRASFTRLVALGMLIFLAAMGLFLLAVNRIAATEAQIRQLNTGLELRVEQHTQELAQVNDSLTQALVSLEHTQDELVESAKLASLGSMVAGVAHELNTPIGNALMAAGKLHEEAKQFEVEAKTALTRSAFDKHLQTTLTGTSMVMSNIARAAELIRGFKQLATDQASDQRRSFSLADELVNIQNAISPTLRKVPYVLKIIPSTDLITMDSYPGPLTSSIINLINNAIIHGFEGRESGTMTIQTQLVDPKQVEILFTDDGVGMTEEVRKRVFEPFFTTKLGQGGSGLGMHMVYNNVTKLLGGRIELESTPQQGTRYRLLLPLSPAVMCAAHMS
jgi:signal transduction histidine kinase